MYCSLPSKKKSFHLPYSSFKGGKRTARDIKQLRHPFCVLASSENFVNIIRICTSVVNPNDQQQQQQASLILD